MVRYERLALYSPRAGLIPLVLSAARRAVYRRIERVNDPVLKCDIYIRLIQYSTMKHKSNLYKVPTTLKFEMAKDNCLPRIFCNPSPIGNWR